MPLSPLSSNFFPEHSALELQPVKGTRDFYPEQMRLRNWLFDAWRRNAEQAGFEEYDTCVLEHEDLYIRKAGDEITQQLYNFEDKGGRRLSLRPEMTPSLARMILQHQKALTFPLKWFSIPQCFRYERMTKGRRREHFQWNADLIGESGPSAEAEILLLLISTFEDLGLGAEDIRIFLNDRRILNTILGQLEVPEETHDAVLVVLDKRDKISSEALAQLLAEQGLQVSQIEALQQFMELRSLEELEARLQNPQVLSPLTSVLELVEEAGFPDYLQFDISIVRGLSYYTGTVFEVNSPEKAHRAICGGGRYDSLLSTYGGETIPAVGFGFGDVVILDVLEAQDKLPQQRQKLDCMILPFSAEQTGVALRLATDLRRQGLRVSCNLALKKMKKALQQADDSGARYALLLFPEELERGEVVLRDMASREQRSVLQSSLPELLTPGPQA